MFDLYCLLGIFLISLMQRRVQDFFYHRQIPFLRGRGAEIFLSGAEKMSAPPKKMDAPRALQTRGGREGGGRISN